jgi:hypothetical protein
VHRYGTDGHIRKTQRMVKKTHNFCVTNLLNSVLQKKRTGVESHYFDVWEPAHQGDADAAERLVIISFYSDVIFIIFILNSIFCRSAIWSS